MGRYFSLAIGMAFFFILISGFAVVVQAADTPQSTKRTLFVDDDWDPVDRAMGRGADDMRMLPVDTLYCFAGSGPGAYGMPGTSTDGFYTFDAAGGPQTAGWVTVDETAEGVYWHLDNAQLNFGRGTHDVVNIPQNDMGQNDYALWCGRLAPCDWVGGDGYGNKWDQYAIIDIPIGVPSQILYDFYLVGDYEGGDHDYWQFLARDGAGDWMVIEENQVTREQSIVHYMGVIPVAFDELAFRFVSDHGASDEDGFYDSDLGGAWIDNIFIYNNTLGVPVLITDFEDGVVPANMNFESAPNAGDYAALYSNLYQEDPIFVNDTYAWAFFDPGTMEPEYPIGVVAYGPPHVDNSIVSPLLDTMHEPGDPTGAPLALNAVRMVQVEYMAYLDNPLNPLVFQTWSVAAQVAGSPCLGQYYGDNAAWYSDAKQWGWRRHNANYPLLLSAQGGVITGISLKLNVVDMYEVWGGIFGDGTGHTPAPYFDNVRVTLISQPSVAWSKKKGNEAQDDAQTGTRAKVRIDSAVNIEPLDAPVTVAGDSIVIGLEMSLDGGIKINSGNPSGEDRPELFLWWRVIEGPNAGSTDPSMGDPDASDGIWSPYTGTGTWYGEVWNSMIADSAKVLGVTASGEYAFDWNDSYFDPGDILEFFYRSESHNGTIATLPENALDPDPANRSYTIVRCLPTAGVTMLLVEDDDRGKTTWEEAFAYNGYETYDIYTTRAPGSGQHNGLAGRVDFQDLDQYEVIIWDSGDQPNFTITSNQIYDKTSDADLLDEFLVNSNHDSYLWVMGDVIANELTNASSFLTQTLGADLLVLDYYDDLTGILVPKVLATHPCLQACGDTPWFWVDGGGPTVENFSVVGLNTNLSLVESTHEFEVDPFGNVVAGILNLDPDGNGTIFSPGGFTNRTLFNPFSYDHAWDGGYCEDAGYSYVRFMVGQVLQCMFNTLPDGAPDQAPETPAYTNLAGSYPNPFNPMTSIRFSLATPEHVKLAVYDAAGRLVRTLVDGPRAAAHYEEPFDGRDDRGRKLASGVYLYKLYAGDYEAAEKLVLLK